MTTVSISGAGAHASAAATDRIPASKAGVKGYLTPLQIAQYALADGDRGDITLSSNGATWTIDNAAVSFAKLAAAASAGFIGATGAGSYAHRTYAQVRSDLDLEAGTDFYSISAADSAISSAVAAAISDTAYDATSWNGVTGVAPSKNAVRDAIEALAAAGVADGDKGDITVSSSGATWTIDNDVVTYAKMQNVSATSRILGRITSGAGDAEELTAANVKTILALAQADISGLTTADSPQFAGVNVGSASDTTITRASAGVIAVEGSNVLLASGLGSITQSYDALLAGIAGLTTAQGDLFYATGSDTVAVLNKSTSSTRYLANTGTSNNPAWAQVDLSNGVTGDLPFANLVAAGSAGFVGATGAGDYAHRTLSQVRADLDLEAGTDFYSISAADAAIAAVISDTAYDATSWNGVTTIAPSKNAVRDAIEALAAGGISDGDKGDITVSSSGATWTIDSGVITWAKLASSFAQGTITDPDPILDMTATWNDASDTFTAIKANITDTASAAASLLLDLQVGGSSRATLSKAGEFSLTSSSASALTAGRQGATNPALKIHASTASCVTGLQIAAAAAGNAVVLTAISSGTNEPITIDAKGSGTIQFNGDGATGAILFGQNATPKTNDAAALGSTSLMWSDLFLASGGVINFNNGNATLTHSSGLLTSNVPISVGTSNAITCGTIELGAASDTTLSRSAAGVLAVEGIPLNDEPWVIACSDESTALTTGTAKATFVFPYNVTVVSVGCSVNTAGTGLTVDINESGTTILSTKITLDSGEKTSLTAATPAVISDSSITAGNEVSIDIDAASGTSKGLKVWMIVRRTS